MISAYIRYRQRVGRYVPFPPPLPSPKHTGMLSLRHHAHLLLWRFLLRVFPATIGRFYTTQQPIFLIGCHNSGTTILANLIGNHPEIVNWSEAPEVWTPDDAFLNWSVLENPPLPVPFLFDPFAYERTVQQHGQYIPLIRHVFTIYVLTRLKGRLLNKNPHISLSIPYIEAAFPDARYVYIRRNGYAVVQSLVSNWRPVLQQVGDDLRIVPPIPTAQGAYTDVPPQAGWGKLRGAIDPVYFDDPLALVRLCARYWRDLDRKAVNDLQTLDPSRVYFTSYETICDNPERVLRDIFQQFDLNPGRYDWGQFRHPTRYPWREMLPMENRNFKYRQRLTPEEIQTVTEIAGDLLAEYGYLDEPALESIGH
jgi:hypothetical protein